MIVINLFNTILILELSYLLIVKGLIGIGYVWVIGQGIVSLGYLLFVKVGEKRIRVVF